MPGIVAGYFAVSEVASRLSYSSCNDCPFWKHPLSKWGKKKKSRPWSLSLGVPRWLDTAMGNSPLEVKKDFPS